MNGKINEKEVEIGQFKSNQSHFSYNNI